MTPDTIQDTVNGILKAAVERASEGADWLAPKVYLLEYASNLIK